MSITVTQLIEPTDHWILHWVYMGQAIVILLQCVTEDVFAETVDVDDGDLERCNLNETAGENACVLWEEHVEDSQVD